jgi:hypothetical protein
MDDILLFFLYVLETKTMVKLQIVAGPDGRLTAYAQKEGKNIAVSVLRPPFPDIPPATLRGCLDRFTHGKTNTKACDGKVYPRFSTLPGLEKFTTLKNAIYDANVRRAGEAEDHQLLADAAARKTQDEDDVVSRAWTNLTQLSWEELKALAARQGIPLTKGDNRLSLLKKLQPAWLGSGRDVSHLSDRELIALVKKETGREITPPNRARLCHELNIRDEDDCWDDPMLPLIARARGVPYDWQKGSFPKLRQRLFSQECCPGTFFKDCNELARAWVRAGHTAPNPPKPASWYCAKMGTDEAFRAHVMQASIHERKFALPDLRLPCDKFRQEVARIFSDFAYPVPEMVNKCKPTAKDMVNLYMLHQEFIHHYFTPRSPLGGMVLWWDVGTGKTCGGMGVLSHGFLNQGYDILWVTRRKLMDAPLKSMLKDMCSDRVRKMIGKGISVQKLKSLRSQSDYESMLKGGEWGKGPVTSRILTYKEFANLVNPQSGQGKSTRAKKLGVADQPDRLRRTLVVVDEAHNLFKAAGDLPQTERLTAGELKSIESAVFRSYADSGPDSVRMLLLTADPVTTPTGFARLLNLCIRLPGRRFPTTFPALQSEFGSGSDDAFHMFCARARGVISYFEGSKDPGRFASKTLDGIHTVKVTKLQEKAIKVCQRVPKNPAKAKSAEQRIDCVRKKAALSKLPVHWKIDHAKFDPAKVKKDLPTMSASYTELFKLIKAADKKDMDKDGRTYKHAIFTDIKGFGLGSKAIAAAFLANGYRMGKYEEYTQPGKRKKLFRVKVPNDPSGKKDVFLALMSTSMKGPQFFEGRKNKETITIPQRNMVASAAKAFFNARPDNVYGEKARFMILDSGFKEGVDLFDVKHFWAVEPPLTRSSLNQAFGRVIRYCGQSGLPYDPKTGWQVFFHVLDTEDKDGNRTYQYILDQNPMSAKDKVANTMSNMAIASAVDYDLNANMLRYSGTGINNAYDKAVQHLDIPPP